MTTSAQPYFFDEAALASSAREPGEREKALNLSIDDLSWLNTVYVATQIARKANAKPMLVYRLMLTQPEKTDIQLAGAFAMSRPDDGEVTLYTPWKGLIKFADMDAVKSKLAEWLAQDTGKRELLRFLSINQRSEVSETTAPEIAPVAIEQAVFADQEQCLERNQAHNLKTMIGELLKMPTLQSMLDESLKNALLKRFPTLNQRHTRLNYVTNAGSTVDGSGFQHSSSLSLSEALLHFYLNNQWPAGDSRTFTNPKHAVSSDADNQAWESAVKEIAQSLTPHLQSLLETFWNTATGTGQSRSALCAEAMSDTFHTRLLRQRQDGVITTQEYLRLSPLGQTADTDTSLRIEKVRITAPLKHYAVLASTLMISSSDTLGFLYTQSRGLEATTDLPAVKQIFLEMLKSKGHEDTLLNFMSLDERGTFLGFEPNERQIVGEPVTGSVFEYLLDDIVEKQKANLSHALSRYRHSEGAQDPHALLDNALDVRGLIDDRLASAKTDGRWSTHADQRWSAQPATVRAESAKEQLARLSTVEQALDQLLDAHPDIPASAGTVAEAQSIVESSIKSLQSSFPQAMSTALHSELKLRAVTRTLSTAEQAIIKTVLDTPVRLTRGALNGFLPDVFSLAIKAGDATPALHLASCFALTERGGLDPKHSGRAILWTPALGFEPFKGLTPLLAELERRLKHSDQRAILLENLGRSERLPGKTYTLAPLQRIDDHFIEHLQKPYVQLDKVCVSEALDSRLSSAPRALLLKRVALRKPLTGLRRAIDIAESLKTQQHLPAWLANASIKDQVLHCELLQQYLNAVVEDKDYLAGVRTLPRTAHYALQKQLKADTFDLDPDKVQVHINEGVRSAASTQTLTRFALTHFRELDEARFDLTSLDDSVIPTAMNESYIKQFIRALKLGEHHLETLKAAFAQTQADSAANKKRFYTQLPWQLMHYAHAEKLQERLGESGFDLIKQVMDMPDAIARKAVDGADAIIRPLEFAGLKDQQTVKVPGVYLIGSSTDSAAPQILIAPYSPRHGLKEYSDETQLLTELKTRGALYDWVLMNLPPTDKKLLKQKLASTDSRTTRTARAVPADGASAASEVSLASNPITGGLFKHLFEDNIDLLGRLLGLQSDNDRQDEWANIKKVVGEDLHEAFSFLTGKLAYPFTVWASYRDIKQSAEDLQTHKWGAAVSEFISAMAQLATLRQSLEPKTTTPTQPVVVKAEKAETTSTRFKWTDVDVTAPERTRLNTHESLDIDLASLTHDTKLGLYTNASKKKNYAPVEGKVYAVAKHGSRWRISNEKKHGRYLRQIGSQWLLEGKKNPPPRFSLFNRLDAAMAVWDGMNIDAHGMSRIRQLFPQKALQIEEGLELATRYLWNSVRNLQLLKTTGATDTPVHQLVQNFIGVTAVLPQHVEKVEKVVSDIFAALLDPTLTKPNSKRFVVGRVLDGPASTYAFTVPTDLKKHIYLAERFFDPQFGVYLPHLSDAAFPVDTHARAATLIHELSHIVSKTEDIAYLDSGRPFVDLIGTATSTAKDLKTALSTVQDTALSLSTPYTQLFMHQDPTTGEWEDLGSTDEDTVAVKKHVLKLTGADNLAEARKIFKKNPLTRLTVQLATADSVAWLITHLGRELHVTTP